MLWHGFQKLFHIWEINGHKANNHDGYVNSHRLYASRFIKYHSIEWNKKKDKEEKCLS